MISGALCGVQGLASQWLKRRDAAADLHVVDVDAPAVLHQLELGMALGVPVILQVHSASCGA